MRQLLSPRRRLRAATRPSWLSAYALAIMMTACGAGRSFAQVRTAKGQADSPVGQIIVAPDSASAGSAPPAQTPVTPENATPDGKVLDGGVPFVIAPPPPALSP